MITAIVTENPISASELSNNLNHDSAGAVVNFSGVVRNHDKGKEVTALRYEIHPSAQVVMESITSEIYKKHDVLSIIVAHRFGAIPIGESAFVVIVDSAHRAPAFACCEEIVERVKQDLPIWKYQEFRDGSHEWVNSA